MKPNLEVRKYNPFDNSRPLDVHKWSEYPEVKAAVDSIYSELKALPGFSGNEEKLKKHVRVVLIDLLHRHEQDPDGYIGYSRNSTKYKKPERYDQLHIDYRPLIKVIDGLLALEYIEGTMGFRDSRPGGKSRQSRMKGTTKLFDKLESEFHVRPTMIERSPETEVIILRDEDKNDIDYEDTAETIRMRELLHRYMEQLNRTYIDVVLKGYSWKEAVTIDLNDKFIRRIFNNRSWKQGGRHYGGWWQRIPRELRKRIVIQGKATTEIDYGAMHIVLLYAEDGFDYFGAGLDDPYTIPGMSTDEEYRNLFKLILLIVVNSKDQSAAKKAVEWELRKDEHHKKCGEPYRGYPVGVDIDRAIEEFEIKHKPIKHHFYSVKGRELQYYDSLVAEKIIEHFLLPETIGLPPLLIHDSFIVRTSFAKELNEIMGKTINEVIRDLRFSVRNIETKLKTITWKAYEDLRDTGSGSEDVLASLEHLAESDISDSEQNARWSAWESGGTRQPVLRYLPV